MKKMTLKEAKANLKKDYIEALASFAEYLNQFEEEDQYDELEKLDERIFEKANWDWNLGEEWLHIYTGLMIAVG